MRINPTIRNAQAENTLQNWRKNSVITTLNVATVTDQDIHSNPTGNTTTSASSIVPQETISAAANLIIRIAERRINNQCLRVEMSPITLNAKPSSLDIPTIRIYGQLLHPAMFTLLRSWIVSAIIRGFHRPITSKVWKGNSARSLDQDILNWKMGIERNTFCMMSSLLLNHSSPFYPL